MLSYDAIQKEFIFELLFQQAILNSINNFDFGAKKVVFEIVGEEKEIVLESKLSGVLTTKNKKNAHGTFVFFKYS